MTFKERNMLNFRFSEKATKFEKNIPLVLTLLIKCQNKWEIFSNFVALSQCLNFLKTRKNAACQTREIAGK